MVSKKLKSLLFLFYKVLRREILLSFQTISNFLVSLQPCPPYPVHSFEQIKFIPSSVFCKCLSNFGSIGVKLLLNYFQPQAMPLFPANKPLYCSVICFLHFDQFGKHCDIKLKIGRCSANFGQPSYCMARLSFLTQLIMR